MNLKTVATLAAAILATSAYAGTTPDKKCGAGSCSKKTHNAKHGKDASCSKKASDASCSKKGAEASCSKKASDASCSKKDDAASGKSDK